MSQSVVQNIRPQYQQRRAAPFLKWAGGKTRLVPELLPRLPTTFGKYFEPFIGGGALFFHLAPGGATISDVNDELTNVYQCVRDNCDALIEDLQRHRYEKNYYYAMRGCDPETLGSVARASRIIYLNRTCFNGLYRVNRRGKFNVPFGRYKNPTICPTERLRDASLALEGVDILSGDYGAAVGEAGPGDFVYFDPPYQPVSQTSNFTSYTAGAFDEREQERLANTFAELDRRGVRCMLSNSDTPLINDLYRDFRVEVVEVQRAIARDPSARRAVREVLVRNY